MSSILSFLRQHGTAAKTTVRIKEEDSTVSLRLNGMPTVYTDAGLAKLANGQASDVAVTVRTEIDASKSASTSMKLAPVKARVLLGGKERASADEPAPAGNGAAS